MLIFINKEQYGPISDKLLLYAVAVLVFFSTLCWTLLFMEEEENVMVWFLTFVGQSVWPLVLNFYLFFNSNRFLLMWVVQKPLTFKMQAKRMTNN